MISLVKSETLKNIYEISSMVDKNSMSSRILMYMETNVIVHLTMCDLESVCKVIDNGVKFLRV